MAVHWKRGYTGYHLHCYVMIGDSKPLTTLDIRIMQTNPVASINITKYEKIEQDKKNWKDQGYWDGMTG